MSDPFAEQPVDYGRYLQSQRRARGISLEQVSQQTKISMSILRQIESEDWAKLPSPTFVKGFLRAYASVVGADGPEALRRYEANGEVHRRLTQSEEPATRSSGFWLRLAWAAVLLAVLIGATIFLIDRLERPDAPVVTETSSVDEAVMPEQRAAPSSEPTLPPSVSPAPPPPPSAVEALTPEVVAKVPSDPAPDASATSPPETPPESAPLPAPTVQSAPAVESPRMVLRVTAVETTWMSVRQDQGTPRELTLEPGRSTTLEAETGFELFIGNAGGVRLFLDDTPLPVPGRKGQVVRLRLP